MALRFMDANVTNTPAFSIDTKDSYTFTLLDGGRHIYEELRLRTNESMIYWTMKPSANAQVKLIKRIVGWCHGSS
jgi:hypothetical protein